MKVRTVSVWIVGGVSWKGRTVLRDGRPVICGHRHRSKAAAGPCVKRMRRERPGKCQDYRAVNLFWLAIGKTAARIA